MGAGKTTVGGLLAEAVLEKFGGDSVAETRRNVQGYLDALRFR
jgi:chorismate synthase